MLCVRGSDCRRYMSLRILTWYGRMDKLLMGLVFTESKEYSTLYLKVEGGILVISMLYVNDLTGEDELIVYARRRLPTKFEMKYLGMMHYLLGMEVWQSADGRFLG